MKRLLASTVVLLGLLAVSLSAHAAPVQYVKVCSIFGADFYYIPGTDICIDSATGDARQITEGGTWRSILPYPDGEWVVSPGLACLPGRIVKLGTFKSTDFTLNPFGKKQTSPITLKLPSGKFISKVMMSGGFYDPRLSVRRGSNGTDGLCVRSTDPNVVEHMPDGDVRPPYGNGGLPIGCIANSRIVNMPSTYSISSTAAYPNIDSYVIEGVVYGPYVYGSQLVITTDLFRNDLTYVDANELAQPLAGTLTVSVCVQ